MSDPDWLPEITQNTDTGDWWIEPWPHAHMADWLKLADYEPPPEPPTLAERIHAWLEEVSGEYVSPEDSTMHLGRMIDDLNLVSADTPEHAEQWVSRKAYETICQELGTCQNRAIRLENPALTAAGAKAKYVDVLKRIGASLEVIAAAESVELPEETEQ